MTSKQKNNLLGIALLVFCVAAAVWGIMRQKVLKKKHVVGIGQVYHYSSGGRGNAGGIWIDYVFNVEGRDFKGSTRYLTKEIEHEGLKHLINRTFPVVYNPKNPSISSLMLLPKDFTNKGFTFPDSLNWVLPYLKN